MMSHDMSMFKKMKDKITDEVNSATNKLQNIQIIDQLATSIGQQVMKDDIMPHQKLPELTEQTAMPSNSHFSLIDDNQVGDCENDDELNSDLSPQHQLFNERSIRRLRANDDKGVSKSAKNGSNLNSSRLMDDDNQPSVIDVNHLSSDLEDDVGNFSTNDDGEVDLLAERIPPATKVKPDDSLNSSRLAIYKTRYRDVVHALRKLNDDHRLQKFQVESEAKKLTDQVSSLKEELFDVKQQLEAANVSVVNNLDSDRKSNSSSPHQSTKQSTKIRDLEKLMAKCKDSLKTKNSQITILKNSLSEVDKFRDYLDELKGELKDLKSTHETWTLSIAENKRVMHQEIEEKNAELDSIKSQLKDATTRLLHQKSNIQNLESRLVSMSAAHQKERESLIKELTNTKNSAIKRLQKEHDLQLERVKLDLEKSIEALKSEVLNRDEQIIKGQQRQQGLEEQNGAFKTDLEKCKKQCHDHLCNFNELKSEEQKHLKKIEELEVQISEQANQISDSTKLKESNDLLEIQAQELQQQVKNLSDELSQLNSTNEDLSRQLEEAKTNAQLDNGEPCASCLELQNQLSKQAENHEQSLFELHAKLDLMTTANTDQEKALSDLKRDRDVALESAKNFKIECEEFSKKIDTLSQLLRDNESEMQAQQEQFEKLRSQSESLRHDNSSLNSSLSQAKTELIERNGDLVQSQEMVEKINRRLAEVEVELKASSSDLENLRREKELLMLNLDSDSKKKREADQQLIVNILAALKNLETPETSPGSDKAYHPSSQHSDITDHDQNLPDPIKLAEKLSSLALDRSTAYMTSNQRLQAVLLDNTMMSEEVKRLRDELNDLSQQKTREVMNSLEEVERLRTENQALIHDQKAYDDHIAVLEAEMESLKQKMSQTKIGENQIEETSISPIDQAARIIEELADKNREIEHLKELIDQNERNKSLPQVGEGTDSPNSTEFEYLKNIVYQFLMGREPVTLARVISAIFKFDRDQMEQICKIQEAIHQVSS